MPEVVLAAFQKNLDLYAQGPQLLRRAIIGVTPEILHFRPGEPQDAWTIHEHVVHVVDSDVSGFFRWRQAFAEGHVLAPYQDEEAWVKRLDHSNESLDDFLLLMETLRRITVRSLKGLDANTVINTTFNHPKNGPTTLVRWAEIYGNHVGFHLEFIERNKKAFGGS